jgi:F-type H+-transporting ATPase subunit epsilon
MADMIAFELVSPERLLLSDDVEMVVVPGAEGDFGVLKGHVPLISTIRPGVIEVYKKRPERSERIFVRGGFAEVTGDRCTVLADQAQSVAELDRSAIDQQIADLMEDMADAKSEEARRRTEQDLTVARAKRRALPRAT